MAKFQADILKAITHLYKRTTARQALTQATMSLHQILQ